MALCWHVPGAAGYTLGKSSRLMTRKPGPGAARTRSVTSSGVALWSHCQRAPTRMNAGADQSVRGGPWSDGQTRAGGARAAVGPGNRGEPKGEALKQEGE